PDRRIWLIFTILFLDVVAGSAIGPVLPAFVRDLPQPQLWLSLSTALFLGMQLFSAPVLGLLGDRYGRRPIFILSAVGTLLATLLLLPVRAGLFFASRLSDGLSNGLYTTLRAAITDISPPERLFKQLGLEGAIVSLGFVLGPLVVGALLLGLRVPLALHTTYVVRLAVGLAVLNVGVSLLLRETHRRRRALPAGALRQALTLALNPLTLWARLQAKEAAAPGLRRLVLTQSAYTLTSAYGYYLIPYLSLGPMQLDARALSWFFLGIGGLSAVTSYLFYTLLADRLPPQRTVGWLAGLGVPVLLAYALVGTSATRLYLVLGADCLTVLLVPGLLEGLLARRTTPADRGEVFGLSQAFQGLANLAGTLVVGGLSVLDLRLPWVWLALCLAGVAWLASRPLPAAPASPAPAPLATATILTP
ncbi:MAG: MFS transporter, partial [Hymenobacter sp.]